MYIYIIYTPITKYFYNIIPSFYNILLSKISIILQSIHGYYIIFKLGILFYIQGILSSIIQYFEYHRTEENQYYIIEYTGYVDIWKKLKNPFKTLL